MSNHARGLWGYSGRTPAGDELTIQATGMGGPERRPGARRPGRARRAPGGPGRHLRRARPELGRASCWRSPRRAMPGAAPRRSRPASAVFPTRAWPRALRRAGSRRPREATVASLDVLHAGERAGAGRGRRRRRHADRGAAGPRREPRHRRRGGADRQRDAAGGRLGRRGGRSGREAGRRGAAAAILSSLKSRVSLCLRFFARLGGESRRARGRAGRSAPRPPRGAAKTSAGGAPGARGRSPRGG